MVELALAGCAGGHRISPGIFVDHELVMGQTANPPLLALSIPERISHKRYSIFHPFKNMEQPNLHFKDQICRLALFSHKDSLQWKNRFFFFFIIDMNEA